jgi:hypothetical protein
MFCPKCGQQNPESGKFCRNCGTDLGTVANALTGGLPMQAPMMPMPSLMDRKGKPVSWESAIGKLFMGIAFFAVSFFLVVSGKGGGWWFWMLIPAFMFVGMGIAQWVMLRKAEKGLPVYSPQPADPAIPAQQNSSLPPAQQQWAPSETRYKTGDLVPPSVTDSTTRHLEMDSEGKTMTLPKK